MSSRKSEYFYALLLLLPFLVIYGVAFAVPTIDMVALSFQKAPLIGAGDWVGLANYTKLLTDKLFRGAFTNTVYFVALTVIPCTILALFLAMAIERLNGWWQSAALACFFLPFMLPMSVVYLIWNWIFDTEYGIAQGAVSLLLGQRTSIFRNVDTFMPGVALVTVWATVGFSVLLFIAGLRNIPSDVYEAARLDGAGRWQLFRFVTWPLIWPVTALVLTIQLIAQLKVFDQVYLFNLRGRVDATMSLVQYIYRLAFQRNDAGYAATVAVALFVIIVAVSVLQFQVLRMSGSRSSDLSDR
jgi:multiple sugar transport system permease protein